MARILLDTNVLIAIFKGNREIKAFAEKSESAVNTIVYLEIIQGSKNQSEVVKIEKYLNRFELIHFDKNVSQRSIELIRTYSKSHGLMLPDAVIAATCLESGVALATLNRKDFHFIEGLVISEI